MLDKDVSAVIPGLQSLPPEILFLILLQRGDPVELLQMQRVCKAFRSRLNVDLSRDYWLLLLKRDFPQFEIPSNNIDYRKAYEKLWVARENNSLLKYNIQRLFFLVRIGDLNEIKKANYSFGEHRSPFGLQLNEFLDFYDKDEKTVLMRALQYKKQDIVDFIYTSASEKIFKTNKKDFRGRTLLYFAAACGNLNEVLRLIDDDNINEPDNDGKTPLYIAALHGHFEVVKALADAGAKIDSQAKPDAAEVPTSVEIDKENSGKTPLWIAAASGHPEIVEALVKEGANINHPGAMQTPVYMAARNGHDKVVAKLIELGADFNRSYHGRAPLHVAARAGHVKTVKALLEAGAEVVGDYQGLSPLMAAVERRHYEVAKLLLAAGANVNHHTLEGTPLWLAAQNGDNNIVKALLAAGADFNQDHDSETALWIAAKKGHVEIVKDLLAAGARIDQADQYGQSPLFIAAAEGHHKVVDLLVSAGANVEQGPAPDNTPLLCAVLGRHSEVVKRLLAAKADHTKTQLTQSPLWLAAAKGDLESCQALLAAGANVHHRATGPVKVGDAIRGEREASVLYIATQNGHYKVVQELIKAGANVNELTSDGISPITQAAQRGNLEVVKALLLAGANVSQRNRQGYTALRFAVELGHKPVADFIKLWELKVANKDQSLSRQVITFLKEKASTPSLLMDWFFGIGRQSKAIQELNKLSSTPDANNTDKIKAILTKNKNNISADKFNFINNHILDVHPKEIQKPELAQRVQAAHGTHRPSQLR